LQRLLGKNDLQPEERSYSHAQHQEELL
jgi:hypothetical protein